MRHNHKEEHRCDSGHSCCADEHKCCCCGDIDVSGHNHDDGEQNAARRWIPVGISLFMLVLGLVFTYYEIAFVCSFYLVFDGISRSSVTCIAADGQGVYES